MNALLQTYVVQSRRFHDGTAFGGPFSIVPAYSEEHAVSIARQYDEGSAHASELEYRACLGTNPYQLPPWEAGK